MKSKTRKLISLIFVICILAYLIYYLMYDINRIKPGERIVESTSPNGTYTITAYLYNGGATVDYAVLCVLNKKGKEKNIYWNYHCNSAEIEWIDDDTVIINGIRLENVEKDTYDYRRN